MFQIIIINQSFNHHQAEEFCHTKTRAFVLFRLRSLCSDTSEQANTEQAEGSFPLNLIMHVKQCIKIWKALVCGGLRNRIVLSQQE